MRPPVSQLLLVVAFICGSCKYNGPQALDVPGRVEVICKQEGVTDKVRAATGAKRTSSKDTVTYLRETIANCCGWFNKLTLAETADTIYIRDLDESVERSACDCSCLFETRIHVSKEYLTKNKVVVFDIRH